MSADKKKNVSIFVQTLANLDRYKYTFAHPFPQRFSLPAPIIQYIIDNPTPEAWKKLVQTCKYFFSKKSVIPVGKIRGQYGRWSVDGEQIGAKTPPIWVYDSIDCSLNIQQILTRIQFSHVKTLKLQSQYLTLNEYHFLTSAKTIKHLSLWFCEISLLNGVAVKCDKLLDNLENVSNLSLTFPGQNDEFGGETGTKLAEVLPSMKFLRTISFVFATETFQAKPLIRSFKTIKRYIEIDIAFERRLPDSYFEDMDESDTVFFQNNLRNLILEN